MDEDDAARNALFDAGRSAGPRPAAAGNPFADDGPSSKAPPPAAAAADDSGEDDEDEDVARQDLFKGKQNAAARAAASSGAGEGKADEDGLGDAPDDLEIDLDFDGLDETTTDVDLETIDADLARFRKHPFVGEALAKGVDLSSYADDLSRQLREVETASVSDYVRQAPQFAKLFKEVTLSEDALGRLQALLRGFKRNLEGIGAEINKLKQETSSKKHGLANRTAVGARLQAFLDKVAVSPEMIASICDGPVDDTFVDDVRALSDKITFAASHGRAPAPAQAAGDGAPPKRDVLAGLGVDPFDTAAGRDALPQLEGLRLRAVSRCRTHLLQAFEELRRPRSNPQAYQAHVLLRQRALMVFLLAHAPDVASEVVEAYVSLWGRSLAALVRSYHTGMMRSHAPGAGAADTVVPDSGAAARAAAGARGGFFARLGGVGQAVAARRGPEDTRALQVAGRDAVLGRASDPPETVHDVERAGGAVALEAVFRATQRHVVLLAATEHAFCLAFFGRRAGPAAYARVMSPPISAALESLEESLHRCDDAVALLLMITLTALHRSDAVEGVTGGGGQHAREADAPKEAGPGEGAATGPDAAAAAAAAGPAPADAGPDGDAARQARRDRGEASKDDARPPPPRGALPVMEGYFDRVTMLLWPRLKTCLDAHTSSIRAADAGRLGAVSVFPHFAALRYAELSASVLSLLRGLRRLGGFGDDMLRHNLTLMRSELDALLGRLAARHPAREVRVAFLHNTYRRCGAVLRERGAPDDEAEYFEEAAAAQADLFAAEAVKAHFGRMAALVDRCELQMAEAAVASGELSADGGDASDALEAAPRGRSGELLLASSVRPDLDRAEAEALVKDFSSTWGAALGRLNEAVRRLVGAADAAGALEVLKKTAFRMLSLYARLLDAVKRSFPSTPGFMREAVSTGSILREIQRYAREGQEAVAEAAGAEAGAGEAGGAAE